MSEAEIDRYLKKLPPGHRSVLERLRVTMLRLVPAAEQCISYRVPAFRVSGGIVGGFASFKNHMSYLPFSGSVLDQLANELDGYSHSKSALRFTVQDPLADELVERLIRVRFAEIVAKRR